MSQHPPLSLSLEDSVALLCLNRAQVHNAIDEATMTAWEQALSEIENNAAVRVVILTGAGHQSFCSGGDLRYFDSLHGREAGKAMSLRMQALLDRLHGGTRPVIAAVNGDAYGGGCEILTACHLRIAARTARFAFRQAQNGVITGWGGGVRLLQMLPRPAALRLLLTSERISAEEALALGLVDRLVDQEALLASAKALAHQIAGNSALAVSSFLNLARTFDREGAAAARHYETEGFADTWVGPDFAKILAKFRR